jgi:hypothetical protein
MDSRPETQKHIDHVRGLLREAALALKERAEGHDRSKLESPEVEVFDEVTPKLHGLTYGSPEYKQALKEMSPALEHHYGENRHHPEHFKGGVSGMNLIDLLEALCDWKAATLRHKDGSIVTSLKHNAERFGISDQLLAILKNTVSDLGWD